MKERELRSEIVEAGRRLYAKGMVAANDGNISAKTGDTVIITPAGVCKGDLEGSRLIKIDMEGKPISWTKGRASSEAHMHLAIYGVRSDVGAVVHAHPIYATAFATAAIPLDRCVLPETVVTIGAVPLIEYATPGTEELSDAMKPYLDKANVFSLSNHGMVAVAPTVMEAYFAMERVEHYARILYAARMLGGEKPLSAEQVEKLGKAIGGELPGIACVPDG